MNPPGLGFICCLVLGIVLLCPAIALLLPSAGLVALLAGMWLELLVKRNMHVAGLWIAMREMPSTAEIATVYPKAQCRVRANSGRRPAEPLPCRDT